MPILRLAVLLYIVAIVSVMILSWFPVEHGSPMARINDLLRRITEPVLGPVRRVIPPIGGALDLSPTVVLFVLLLVYRIL